MDWLSPTEANIERAARALREGQIVACPTDTVYGLCADPLSPAALATLFDAKGRGADVPVLLIVAGEYQLSRYVACVSRRATRLMRAFWPGPLSLTLPAVDGLPESVSRKGKVCVRCPANDIARALCEAFGGALTSTSANLSGEPPAMRPDEIRLPFVEFVIDAGELPVSPVSTIYDPDEDLVVREGAVPAAALRNA